MINKNKESLKIKRQICDTLMEKKKIVNKKCCFCENKMFKSSGLMMDRYTGANNQTILAMDKYICASCLTRIGREVIR